MLFLRFHRLWGNPQFRTKRLMQQANLRDHRIGAARLGGGRYPSGGFTGLKPLATTQHHHYWPRPFPRLAHLPVPQRLPGQHREHW